MTIRAGAELVIVSYILPLPIEFVEIHVVVDSIKVEELEKPITPN